MVSSGNEADREERHRQEMGSARATGLETGWNVASYMLAGLIAYGAIGWLLARVTHLQLLFPLGMIFGIAVSVGYVIYRYGRQGAEQIKANQRIKANERANHVKESVERNDR